jgi:uncharacterized Rmd1/YagE family protein
VVVFWNFTERQERDILADLTFAGNSPPPSRQGGRQRQERYNSGSESPVESTPLLSEVLDDDDPISPTSLDDPLSETEKSGDSRPTSLMLRVLKEMDVQIEDFHFEYNPRTRSPRIRDDMITFAPSCKLF